MLIIRLQRTGRTKLPLYRLVLAEKHRHVSKKVQAVLGTYNPRTKVLVVQQEELLKWSSSVHFSDTAYNLLLKNGALQGAPRVPKFTPKKAPKPA